MLNPDHLRLRDEALKAIDNAIKRIEKCEDANGNRHGELREIASELATQRHHLERLYQ